MILYKYVTLLFFITLYIHVQAQETVPLYLGTKTTYRPLQTKPAAPPKGFTPVFINYVGRHGARFMTKPGSDILVADILQQAKQQNALTKTGKKVQQTVIQFANAEKNNYENITLLGAQEQNAIGKRISNEYRNAFDKKDIEVWMTTKVRTQQSAKAFLQGIPDAVKENIQQNILPDSTDAMLRFYDMSPAYNAYLQSKSLQRHLDSLQENKRMMETAKRVCSKLFTQSFCQSLQGKKITADDGSGKKKPADAIAFLQALYDVYTVWFSASKEIQQACGCKPVNYIEQAFTSKDLQWLNLVNNAEDFYEKGPAEDTLGIQVTIAVPLLVDFINTTDSVVNGTKHSGAALRFTHAEAIAPFATLLGIPQASVESHSVYTYQQHWQASQIIPLSANIQWILYTSGNHYLVKVLLNEKEVKLPIPTNSFPYYDWKTVRRFYVDKLNGLGASLQGNMQEYLHHTKNALP